MLGVLTGPRPSLDFDLESQPIAGQPDLGRQALACLQDNRLLQGARYFWSNPVLIKFPQYRYIARPVNRLLGGPSQPMSSSLGAALVTDYLMHQVAPKALTVAVCAALRLSTESLPGVFQPNPLQSCVWGALVGLPTGLHKLGCLFDFACMQRTLNACVTQDRRLQRQLAKLLPKAETRPDIVVQWLHQHVNSLLPALAEQLLREGSRGAEQIASTLLMLGRHGSHTADARHLRPLDGGPTRGWVIGMREAYSFDWRVLLARDSVASAAWVGILAGSFFLSPT